jgi:CRISPR-associated endonuclease/helicase Cas3
LLPYHCLDVAAAGDILLRQQRELTAGLVGFLGVGADALRRWLTFVLAIHDVGKFADGFQSLRPDLMQALQGRQVAANYLERHDTLGYRFAAGKPTRPGSVIELFAGMKVPDVDPADLWDLLVPWLGAGLGHHGRPPVLSAYGQPLSRQFPADVARDANDFLQKAMELFLPEGPPFDFSDYGQCEAFRRTSWLVAGLAVAADWIGSNEAWFPYRAESMPLHKYWIDIALPQAETAVGECGLLAATPAPWAGVRGLFPKIESPTPLQCLVEKIELSDYPQLFVVEEVTGGGKTEAAISLAHRLIDRRVADGIYLALPTMATANAMHSRVRALYKRLFAEGSHASLILAHSASRMALALEQKSRPQQGPQLDYETANQQCSEWLSDSRKKALLAHVGVGTIDQALLAVLAARHQSMRLFGLCRKVLIVDEVHACDAYVNQLLCKLLQFHAALGGSAILLSATLPARMRAALVHAFARGLGVEGGGSKNTAYPLVTRLTLEGAETHRVAARESACRRVAVQPLQSKDEVQSSLLRVLTSGGCACWVRNTVDDAMESFREWTDRLGPERVTLFHARFALADRLRIESEVMRMFGPESSGEERSGRFLIATQVVEQSLDLDFDGMVSDLAPIDLLIQRAGRLERHNRNAGGDRSQGSDCRPPPELGVFMPKAAAEAGSSWYASFFPTAAYVYPHHGQLWLTAHWLCQRLAFSMPEDARDMIEAVYGEAAQSLIPEGLLAASQRAEGNINAMSAQGRLNGLDLEDGYVATATHWQDDAYAPTRLGEPTVTVRLAKWENSRLVPWAGGDPRDAWQLSQLTIRRSKIAGESPELSEAVLNATRETMPDGGKYCVIVPLERKGDSWLGAAVNRRSETVKISYDERFGLQFPRGENA